MFADCEVFKRGAIHWGRPFFFAKSDLTVIRISRYKLYREIRTMVDSMNDLPADRAKPPRRLLQPQEVEKFLGLTPENLRDQRRRGILGGVGQQEAGRWLYSADDVLILAIAQALFQEGVDLPSAIGIAKFAAPNVFECWSYADRSTYPNPILVAFPGRAGITNVVRWTDPESVASINAMVSYRIDVRQITERLSKRVWKLIMAANINDDAEGDQ